MQKQGTVVRWNEERGFGFIRSAATSPDIFFHIRDFHAAAGRAPGEGLEVSFEEIHVGGKGPRAMAVQVLGADPAVPVERGGPARNSRAGAPPARRGAATRSATGDRRDAKPRPGSGAGAVLPLMLAYALALLWAVSTRRLPWWVLTVSPALNLLAFFAYWQDKYAAETRQWRTMEDTLHLWSLAGGWGGAWLAQQVLRHKSSKHSFLAIYRATVVLHCAALAGWLWWSATR